MREIAEHARWRQTGLLATSLLVGTLLGWVAWGTDRSPAPAALLLILVVMCRTRAQAFLLGAGYTIGVLRHTAAFISGWFDDSLWAGSAAVLTYALISGAVWSLGWSGSDRLWRRALAPVIAWVVAILPPATVGVPGHPVIAWGSIAPGSQWAGLMASALLPSIWIVWMHRAQGQRSQYVRLATLALMASGLVYLGQIRFQPPSSYGPSSVAVSTEWGKTGGADDVMRRIESIGTMSQQLGQESGPLAVFWPESILGVYHPLMFPLIEGAVLHHSDRFGQTVVIGIDLPLPGNLYENAAVAFYPDGRSAVAVARQPAPMSLWRPWRRSHTWLADWTAQNTLALNDGRKAALIFCYEEYLPILYLINELRDDPDQYVAMANTWAEKSEEGSAIQTQHSMGIARLFGKPYIKAENRPVPAGRDRLPIVPISPQN